MCHGRKPPASTTGQGGVQLADMSRRKKGGRTRASVPRGQASRGSVSLSAAEEVDRAMADRAQNPHDHGYRIPQYEVNRRRTIEMLAEAIKQKDRLINRGARAQSSEAQVAATSDIPDRTTLRIRLAQLNPSHELLRNLRPDNPASIEAGKVRRQRDSARGQR